MLPMTERALAAFCSTPAARADMLQRRQYEHTPLDALSARPQLLFELCRFRNRHPAFDGVFELLDTLTHVKDAVVIAHGSMPSDAPAAQQDELALESGSCHACGVSFSVASDVDW
jgi:hypothetical protein